MSSDSEAILHVVFGYSAAGSLRQAIEQAGRSDEVIGQYDRLDYGPIDPPEPKARAEWMRIWLGWDRDDELDSPEIDLRLDDEFWRRATTHEGRLIVWFSRRSSGEYCGFLELVWRLGDRPCEIVDLTDVPQAWTSRTGERFGPKFVVACGIVHPRDFFADDYFGRVRMLGEDGKVAHRKLWQGLRLQNSALRVLENGQLISAPITHFDDLLVSFVKSAPRKAARVIGDVWAADFEKGEHQAADTFYWARMLHLIDSGRIAAKGDLSSMRATEVRLP